MSLYLRYESVVANSCGNHTGIFGLANGLARSHRLSPCDQAWWRQNNDWLNAAYSDPATIDPTLFDRALNPVTACWFKAGARDVLERVPGYLALLDRYDVAWRLRQSDDPGLILYDDDVQIVVRPRHF